MAKILCVDFDGVVHSYSSGWKGVDVIPDPPVPGVFRWLASLHENEFVICIYSSRSKDPAGVEAMKAWFEKHLNECDWDAPWLLCKLEFPTQKPAAMMTVDDRAFCFEGDFPSPEWIDRFKPWNRR